MALGGNRNTAYCHALFAYNQRVKCIGDRSGNRNRKTFLFVMAYNQLCRNHELHYANSSTSFHDFIHFISRVHLLHWVDTYGCGGWRRRLSWQNETAALAEGVECSGWRRRMQWPEETNAIAEGVECSDRRRRMLWQEETHSEHL